MANLRDVFSIDSDFFDAPMQYVETSPKYEYVEGSTRDTPRVQKRDATNNYPVWRVTVMVANYGALSISIPSADEPTFEPFSRVSVANLRVGYMSRGFWANASGIEAV